MKKYKGSQSIKSKSRKRSFGKTKPNYNSLIKEEWEDFLRTEVIVIKPFCSSAAKNLFACAGLL